MNQEIHITQLKIKKNTVSLGFTLKGPVSDISVKLGGVELLGNETYDIIYANINRNILLNDMHVYARCMHPGSEIYFSGFYVDDIPVIKEEAEKCDLKFENYIEKNIR